MRMRHVLLAGAISLAGASAMPGYGHGPEKVVIDGSTGVMPLAAALGSAFRASEPAVAVELGTGLGTKARLKALADGKIDIALASHGIDPAEVARHGFTVHEIARLPVVFGLHAALPVTDLSHQQICDVYSGRTSNWQALGGPDLQVAARTRPESEVDTEVVRAGIECLRSLPMAEAIKVMPKGGDMARELASTPGAIGMTTMTVVQQSQGRIRGVSLNGVAPSPEAVARNAYPLVRQSFFVVRTPASPAVARFIAFARGPSGGEVIVANGAMPGR
jgi:phosphate transport system substrate-binding protein